MAFIQFVFAHELIGEHGSPLQISNNFNINKKSREDIVLHYANCLPDIHFTFSIFKFQFVNFRSGNIGFALTKLSTRTGCSDPLLTCFRDKRC